MVLWIFMVMVLPKSLTFIGLLLFLLVLAEGLNYMWRTHSAVSTEED